MGHVIRLLATLVVSWGLFSATARADLGISPAFISLDMDKPVVSGTFVVTNTTNKARRYRARTMHFSFSDTGGVTPVEPDDYSLAEWVRFNPREFTLEPKSSRKIRYVIVKPKNQKLKAREYWGAISFEPLEGRRQLVGRSGYTAFGYEAFTNVLLPIFANLGDQPAQAEVQTLAIERTGDGLPYLSFRLRNQGEISLRLRGEALILDNSSKVIARIPLPKVFVLPQHESTQNMPIRASLPEGDYQVRLDLQQDYSDYQVLEKRAVSLK